MKPNMTETRIWITLDKFPSFEMSSDEPGSFRKKSTGQIMKQTIQKGYYMICLGWKNPQKVHRVIAEQLIPNPNEFR
jgi:hypothetical protein